MRSRLAGISGRKLLGGSGLESSLNGLREAMARFGDKKEEWGRSTISQVNTGSGREIQGAGADEALKEFGREENKRWPASCERVASERSWFYMGRPEHAHSEREGSSCKEEMNQKLRRHLTCQTPK